MIARPDRATAPLRPGRHGPSAAARTLASAAALALLLVSAPARAGIEEFSTFNVEEQERDDESLLDHMLSRAPNTWRDEWERSLFGVRSSQGCLTSGRWINYTEAKLHAPLGRRAWFGFALRQSESDRFVYDYTEFSFHVQTRVGAGAWLFRPARDKSDQDMALLWDIGADTSAFQLNAAFSLEDVFNNFWEFRQVQTGGRSEPYLRHPFEPGLRMVVRQPDIRIELGGRYLTPSVKRVIVSEVDPSLDRIRSLWGTYAWASVEARALGFEWEAHTTNHQASSTDRPESVPLPDGRDFRRQWWFEGVARRRLHHRLVAEARWLYQERTQVHAPPVSPPRFDAIDRVVQVDALWAATPSFALRLGGAYDRITIDQSAVSVQYSAGSRSETRAYVGFTSRHGKVSLQIMEAIELDRENYDVWAVHDKGFVQLQAVF